jgi:ribosomal protein L9
MQSTQELTKLQKVGLPQLAGDQILGLAKKAKRKKEAETIKAKIEKISCSISKKVGEQDKLFGSVTTQDIEKAFKAEGFEIDKREKIYFRFHYFEILIFN